MKLNAPVKSAATAAFSVGLVKEPGSIRNGRVVGTPAGWGDVMVMVATAEVLRRIRSAMPLSVPSISTLIGVRPGEPIPASVNLATGPLHAVVVDVQVIVLCVIKAVGPRTFWLIDAVNGDSAIFVAVKLVTIPADVVRAPRNVKPNAIKGRIV